ncbi:MAG: prenyltransferase [bacterium]
MNWRVLFKSARPPFLILTPVCLLTGVAAATHLNTDFHWLNLMWVAVAAISAHISVNALNEYQDFKSGLDLVTSKTPFSGGSGALPERPEFASAVLMLALVSLCITMFAGIGLVLLTDWRLAVAGVLGVLVVVGYTRYINRRPLLCLIAPGLAFGPIFVWGTAMSLSGGEATTVELAGIMVFSLPSFFLVNNLLLMNQLPDAKADRTVGRRTFPIVFGELLSLRVYLAFQGLAALLMVGIGTWLQSFFAAAVAILPVVIGYHVYSRAQQLIGVNGGDPKAIQLLVPLLRLNVVCVLLSTLFFALLTIRW